MNQNKNRNVKFQAWADALVVAIFAAEAEYLRESESVTLQAIATLREMHREIVAILQDEQWSQEVKET